MTENEAPTRDRSALAVTGFALGVGAVGAAIVTVVLSYAAPSFPPLASIVIGVVVGGALGAWRATARGVDV